MITRAIIVCILAILIFFLTGFKITMEAHAETPLAAATIPFVPWKDDKVFNSIGGCESVGNPTGTWDYHAKNGKSSASGVFQWINSSWYYYGREFWGEDFYTKNIWTKDNVELAWYVYKKYGTRDWSESRICWGKVAI